VALLNEYFTIMVDCVQREGGMLDKFIGDAMLAAFGIPIANGDDEDRGVRAAITMVAALRHWNNERAQRGLPTVAMGIGLNTDVMVSGNIGSPKRMDYTVIGDGVNLAARLESACKRFHTEILISEQTRCRLKTPFRLRPVDTIIVKGRTQPVDVFEVLDHHTEETYPNLTTAIPLFTEAVDAYRQARFAEAAARFAAVLDLHANDRLACLYLERCRRLMTAPPEQDWRAISVLDEK
jgi:adenylate cyclase